MLHQKFVSKPLPNSFQNPLSRLGENRSGVDGQFIQLSSPSLDTDDIEEEEEETQSEEEEKAHQQGRHQQSKRLHATNTDRTRQTETHWKLNPKSPGANNLKLHVDNLKETSY